MMDALLKSGVSYDDDDYVDWSDDDDLICTSKFVVSSEEDDEELLTVARAKLKRKKALARTVVRTSDDDDDEDDNDFEKEMASELSQTMQHLTTSFARSQQKNSVSAGDTSSSHAEKASTTAGDAGKQGNTKRVQFKESCMSEGKEEAKFYDDIYFDSDDSDDNEAAGASSSRRAKEKRRMLTNDELFYDPTLDDRDQAWVDKRRRSYQVTKKRDSKSTGSSNVARPASRPQALPQSDAVLNCPACLTTLCLDCQRLNNKMSKKRTYSDAFLHHGFVNLPSGGEDRPQCVICHKVLTNESLKPSKLSAHLQKCHPNLQNKDQAYFQRQVAALKNIQFGSSGIRAQKLQAAVEASYFVAYKVAEQQKCHTIAENLIMPCAYEMVSKVCGEDQAKKLGVISLSDNTIRRRIDDMASDILSQVITEIKESSYSKFSLQFDESCDVASCAVLLGFVRYVHQDRIKEEFLLCEDLLTTTKGEDVFNIIKSFFTKNGLDWNSVQQVSVDGAPAMMGGHRGLRGLIQAVNPEISVDHCIIHRYSLGSKSLPGNLKLVFQDVLKIVNFIKSRDVNSRIFKELCKEMGEQYQVLLYHTDVRWLSRGKVVHRVIELRKALQEFLEQKGSPFATKFTDKEWLARLCYLADIFAELNSGNLQLQGRNTTVIDAHHTVAAFLGKLRLWIRRLEKGVIAQFPTLDQFVEENIDDAGSVLQTINKEMSDHLKGLETSMHQYFPESDQETASLQWIIHPFSVPDEAIHDDDFPAKEEWITMRANEALKIEFQNQNADSFWISRLADSPTLSKRALKLLVSFSTTYLCEKGFSTVLGMKTKKRARLNVANDARLALSTTQPRISQLASSMQLQPSH